ncbi:hypothetical protein [Cupriavidus taiwanensis]|uniref:hypothetical protein n=1 Tax=Cupriavidus taiwanensis TaxID=164546 RepID=UPI002163846C|nr:hypothetical protein [Cupriavidus taiwanensis]
MDRRQLLARLAATAVALALPGFGHAQAFPSKPVRLVVPQAGGTGNDVLARALAEKLSRAWQQPVVVENRPGANGRWRSPMCSASPPTATRCSSPACRT